MKKGFAILLVALFIAAGVYAVYGTDKVEEVPTFVIELENGGILRGELYPETAPISVGNFIELANSGFYDGLIFHRVIPGFMIQGGGYTGNSAREVGWRIKGEFASNGVKNDMLHTYGVLSMARTSVADSATSQFFIMVGDATWLDGEYAAFGKVLEGMEFVEEIVNVPTDSSDMPLSAQVIKSIRVETNGVEYPFEKIK